MVHPVALIRQYETDFARHLPSIRDGDPEAIHQGRVATRRLREGLRLLDEGPRVHQALATARTVGRALGHVRELDVLADLLRMFQLRVPATAAAAATALATLRVEQRQARRRMVKSLDDIDLTAVSTDLMKESDGGLLFRRRRWQHRVFGRIEALASQLDEALSHASGIYLPNRSHQLRVVVKKVRYALEAAHATHVWPAPAPLRVLRRAQSRLGDLHDLHIAHQWMNPDRIDSRLREHVAILREAIAADIDRRQQQFLALRDSLVSAAADCQRVGTVRARLARGSHQRTMLIAAAAVPGVAALIAHALTSGKDSHRAMSW